MPIQSDLQKMVEDFRLDVSSNSKTFSSIRSVEFTLLHISKRIENDGPGAMLPTMLIAVNLLRLHSMGSENVLSDSARNGLLGLADLLSRYASGDIT